MEPGSPAIFRGRVTRYGFAVLAVVLAFLVRKALEQATGTGASFSLFFGAILFTSVLAGVGPGILATLLGLPLGAHFVSRAGFPFEKLAIQALLFAADAAIIIYLSHLVMSARRASERAAARVQELLDL